MYTEGMYVKVLCGIMIFGSVLSANGGDPVFVIEITKNPTFQCSYHDLNMKFGQYLIIEIHYSNITFSNVNCYTSTDKSHELTLHQLNPGGNPLKLRVENLTSMSKKWRCSFRLPRGLVNCDFPVNHLNQNTAYVFVNGVNIKDVQMKTAPAPAQYTFVDGEVADIDCTNDVGSPAQLEYYTALGELVLSTGALDVKPVNLKLKLTKASDNSYVHCITTYYGREETKLVFHLQTADTNNSLQVYIDDLMVHPHASKSVSNLYTHRHKFRPGDNNAILQCRNKYNNHYLIQTSIDCSNCLPSASLLSAAEGVNARDTQESSVTLNLANLKNDETTTCSLITDTNAVMERVEILFVQDNEDLYVTGLPKANITAEYKPTKDSVNINYEYSEDEDLNLFCTKYSRNRAKLSWISDDDKELASITEADYVSYLNLTFNLKALEDTRSLRCVDSSRESTIRTITIRFINKSSGVAKLDDKALDVLEPNVIKPWVLAVMGFGTAVIIVFVICFIYCRMRKSKNNQDPTNDITYENLRSRNDSSLPHPTQWEEPTYSEAFYRTNGPVHQNNLEDLYSKPIPKKYRNKPDGNYGNVDNERTYEAVGDVNEVNYADLAFDNVTKRLVMKREDVYAEVIAKRKDDRKCDNGYENSGYVNAQDCGYVEPVYCEVNKLRNK